MSQYCAADPIQRMVSRKGPYLDTQQQRVYKHRSGTGHGTNIRQPTTGIVEANFLQNNSGMNAVHPTTLNVQTHNAHATGRTIAKSVDTNSWVNDFSSMKVQDPLEFADSYKNLYKQYEQKQFHNTVPAQCPRNLYIPTVTRPQTTLNIVDHHEDKSSKVDQLIDDEFEKIEEEVKDQNQKLAFQESAQSFIEICERSQMKEKLQRSKFFQVMQKVSDGEATIRQDGENYVIR
ncbi:Hypothetical protein J6889_01573 [Nakaseomyces glabratus]|nr:peroxisomal membrane protein pex21 [Nakaseomyces glabratus]